MRLGISQLGLSQWRRGDNGAPPLFTLEVDGNTLIATGRSLTLSDTDLEAA